MTKIHEILELNLEEDIKNVIDLEDRSETEVKYEIESYIVTENIGKYFLGFCVQIYIQHQGNRSMDIGILRFREILFRENARLPA